MKAAAWMLLAIGGGLFAWAIGSRLSTDAVGMGVGLVFGVLAGIPAALLVVATARRGGNDDGAYEAGYRAGVRDTTDMQRGIVRQLPEHRPAAIVVEQPAPQYTMAHPFAVVTASLPALVGEVVDEAELDWDDPAMLARYAPSGRKFRIIGEVES